MDEKREPKVSISSIEIRPNPEREAAHRVKMRRIAETFVEGAPSWLCEILYEYSFEFRWAQSMDALMPTGAASFERLTKVNRLIGELRKLVDDGILGGFLVGSNEEGESETVDRFRIGLEAVHPLVWKALKSPLLVDAENKVLRGRGKPTLHSNGRPRHVCVAIIAEIAAFLEPRLQTKFAQRRLWLAASLLWNSFDEQKKWGEDRLRTWEDHFAHVDDKALGEMRGRLRFRLAHEAWWETIRLEGNAA